MRRTLLLVLSLTVLAPHPAARAGGGGDQGKVASPNGMVLAGTDTAYKPLADFHWFGVQWRAQAGAGIRLEGLNSFPVDRDLTMLETGFASDLQVRIGASINTMKVLAPFNLLAVYEHDLATGALSGKPDIEGQGYTNSHGVDQQLRKAYLRASLGTYLHLMGGFMTSHWGLGLVANDGAHGWHPRSGHFADPRGGDRVLRVMLSTGPVTSLGLSFAVGYDWVQHDDAMLHHDKARQVIGSASIGYGQDTALGFYGVYRTQEAESGGEIKVGVLDLYGRYMQELSPGLTLTVEAEAALIIGHTTLGPTPERPQKDVLQLAGALRASLGTLRIGGVLDLLVASGDANYDDAQQTDFRTDPNYELSLFLYRYVMSGQTGRAAYTAANTGIVGYPTEDLDRIPTRERTTNTVAIFPRVYWLPLTGLEVYGGPLFAFTLVPLADPFNTRLAGGSPRNALNGVPGSYLGTELNLGTRFRMLMAGTQLTVGGEFGVLFAGSALQLPDGTAMDPVVGGRMIVRYRF